jgi:serine/threonine protein kinase|uniref:Protein kinase domain-containing protein n=1 Tax=Panagrolaimus sp. PS1159 TaxID=55785 RepID=A0AC35FXY4_9BILA
MPSYAPAFNRILDDLAKRQLRLDFQFGTASNIYEPLRSIGAGAFGIVAEAKVSNTYKSDGENVAIKKIGHASSTPTLARRTLREVRVLRYIRHPNIVVLKDVFRTSGSLGMNVFMVMELMEGSLHNVIHGAEEPLEWDLIAHLLHQILRGLRYIHKAGIAHRDLKPSNLLVNSDGHLRIADFGMAKLATGTNFDEADEHCFYMTQHIATLPYRAPELLFVMPEHSTAVDMYAVGCIFAEMILRRELFPGRSVSSQIKIVLTNLGTPSKQMINDIQCERTKQFIQSFGSQTPLPWEQIVLVRDRQPNFEALEMISQLCQMDPSIRMNVNESFEHIFIKTYFPKTTTERVCPFKVKLDMFAVESIDHKQLIHLIENDIRCADEEEILLPQSCNEIISCDETQEISTRIIEDVETENNNNHHLTHKSSTSGASSASYYSMSSAGSQAESYDPTHSLYDADRRSPRRNNQKHHESELEETDITHITSL